MIIMVMCYKDFSCFKFDTVLYLWRKKAQILGMWGMNDGKKTKKQLEFLREIMLFQKQICYFLKIKNKNRECSCPWVQQQS